MYLPLDDLDGNVLKKIREMVGTEAKINLVSHDEVRSMLYRIPINDKHWYLFIDHPIVRSAGLLTVSWLIVVSKENNQIIYNGPANDEG